MQEKKATFLDAIKVWWAITWRFKVALLPIQYAVNFMIGALAPFRGLPGYYLGQSLLAVAGMILLILVIRYAILNKEFSDFKLTLIKKKQNERS
jgi:hypothetical protein